LYSKAYAFGLKQWLNYSKIGGGTLHFLSSFSVSFLPFPFFLHSLSLPSPSLPPLEGPLNPATGYRAPPAESPARIEFGAFEP